MKLSIVMPTIPGRLSDLERTRRVYEELTPVPIQWVVETGHGTCGEAWNAGVRRCTGDVVHMGADDVEPESDRWLPAALETFELSGVPLGLVREPSGAGTFGRDFARVVICPRAWWRDVPPIHYYSDNAFDDLMRRDGHTPRIAEGFDFYHRKSMVGRDESGHYAVDLPAYEAWRSIPPSS